VEGSRDVELFWLFDLGVSLIARGVEAVDPRRLRDAKELDRRIDCELDEEGVEEEALLVGWRVKYKVCCIFCGNR